jgi:hypothetical protein
VKTNYRAIAESYGRSLLVALFSVYATNPDATAKQIISGALIAVFAPVLRALNREDKAFGLGSKE